jgi:hypothetical protein
MTEPIYVVGIHLRHAEIWSKTHLSGTTVRPVFVSPEIAERAFRGQRNRIIILLPEAYIPEDVLNHSVYGRNILIDLTER